MADAAGHPRRADRSGAGRLRRLVAAAGFWTAALLPAVYVPLFVAGVAPMATACLLGAHVVALMIGRDHRAESTPGEPR